MPRRGVSLARFSRNASVCTSFQDALAVKIPLDLPKGLWSYGVLSWQRLVIPKFSAPLVAKLFVRPPKVLEVQERAQVPAKFGGDRISPASRMANNVEFLCLSVCLFVCSSCFWMSEIVCPISPWRRWSTKTILMSLDRGRFVAVHPCSTFSDCCQLATPLNAEVQKTAKIAVFHQQMATE